MFNIDRITRMVEYLPEIREVELNESIYEVLVVEGLSQLLAFWIVQVQLEGVVELVEDCNPQ